MMSIGKDAASGSYYGGQDNYYFMGALENKWVGEGAKELGLTGEVDSKVFDKILEGELPNGQKLGKTVDGKSTHRSGYDLTFGAPKSVSLLVLMGGDERLLHAHEKAVEQVAEQIEQLISARVTKDKVTETVYTEKMVAAAYTHDTSRNHDPHLHTHLVVANVTEHDGKWRALATDKINNTGFIETVMKHQVTLGQMYRNYLRKEVELAGHEVEVVGKNGLWEIKGVPREIREEFSTRSQDIKESVGDSASLHSKDVAALDTRDAKTEKDPAVLKSEWIERAKAKGFDVNAYLDSVSSRNQESKGSPEPNINNKELAPQNSLEKEPNTVRSGLQKNQSNEMNLESTRMDSFQTKDVVSKEVGFFLHEAVKVLSNEKAQFSYGDLLSKAVGLAEGEIGIKDFKSGINQAIESGSIIPLNEDKGVFTSQIHILDELSIQSMAKELVGSKEGVALKKVNDSKLHVEGMLDQSLLVINAKGAGARVQREQVGIVSEQAKAMGRIPLVLAGSVSSMNSLKQDQSLSVINKNMLQKEGFFLRDHSTVIVDRAEKLSLKEATVLLGYAQQSNSQIVFIDTEGVSGVGNALSVLKSAGVQSERIHLESTDIPTSIHSIPDRKDRISEAAKMYINEKESGKETVLIATNQKDMREASILIREGMQERGLLSHTEVAIEARTPVYLTERTKKDISNYQKGMIIEITQDDKSTQSFVISGVHEKTRKLSVIQEDGSKDFLALKDFNSNYKLYQSEILHVAAGDTLRAVANDYSSGIKAKDQLKVTETDQGWIEVERQGKRVTLDASKPLYIQHDYVSGIGSQTKDSGSVIALLKGADLNPQTLNSLASSGDEVKIFTAEKQDTAERKVEKLREKNSPLKIISKLTAIDDHQKGVESLISNVHTDTEKSVNFAIEQLMNKQIVFSDLDVQKHAMVFSADAQAIQKEISARVKDGELIGVQIKGENAFVSREAYEMEKTIIRVIEEGKGTQQSLIENADPKQLENRLTKGQAEGAKLILTSKDQFIGIQGYAGVGKTFMLTTVEKALSSLPETERPVIQGLAPTHQAVSEMNSVGIESKTLKSFLMDNKDLHLLESNQFKNHIFLIDESSMIGNPDMASALQTIQKGGGRAVLIGDKSQLISPEGSAPFQLAQERSSLDVAILKDIQRQTNWQLKGAVYDLIENNPSQAIEKIKSVKPDMPDLINRETNFKPGESVVDFSNETTLMNLEKQGIKGIHDAIAKDYAGRAELDRDHTLIVTHTNKDRLAVNEAIHYELRERGALKGNDTTIPILRRLADDKRSLNNINTYEAGNVLQIGDKFLDVVSVKLNDGLILLKDDAGKVSLLSPFENSNPDIALYEKAEIAVAVGEKIRLSKTIKESGHQANNDFKITKIDEQGRLHVTGKEGDRIFNPREEKADRVIDYSYAKTGYHHQGASERFVISLEGAENGRKNLATLRSFYVSASREKEHIQIYADNYSKWLTAVEGGDKKTLTVHDALKPESERATAQKIWGMGSTPAKTKLGSMFLQQNDLPSFASKVIPATKRFPDPHLAIPVYGEKGKFGGVQLMPIMLSRGEVTINENKTRMVANEDANWSILKISKSGVTKIANDFSTALKLMQRNPEDGLILKLRDKEPTESVLRTSKGSIEEYKPRDMSQEDREQKAKELQAALKIKEQKENEAKQAAIESVDAKIQQEVMTKKTGGLLESEGVKAVAKITSNVEQGIESITQKVIENLSQGSKSKQIRIPNIEQPDSIKSHRIVNDVLARLASQSLSKTESVQEPASPELTKIVSVLAQKDLLNKTNIRTEISIQSDTIDRSQLNSVRLVADKINQQTVEQMERVQDTFAKEQSVKTKQLTKDRSLDKTL